MDRKVERERKRIERELGREPTSGRLTKAEIKTLVRQLIDIVAVLADADPEDRQAIYAELGVSLTFHPDGRTRVGAGAGVLPVGVEGTRSLDSPRAALRGELTTAIW